VKRVIQAMLEKFQMRTPPRSNPPPSGLSASIQGTTAIGPSMGCSWSASVSGGAAPYTYLWMVNGSFMEETSASLSYWNNGSPFTISVIATDENGQTSTAHFNVSISRNSRCAG